MALTPRGRALRWLTLHRGITEDPAGSNRDGRVDGITAAQKRCAGGALYLVAKAWCGVWAWNAANAGGVKVAHPERWASVTFIEDDARAKRNGFRGWIDGFPRNPVGVFRGDLVVLFGRGVHVETIRLIVRVPGSKRFGWVLTDGGNTSSDNGGSQNNGGGSYRRWRRLSDVHGVALVDYPG